MTKQRKLLSILIVPLVGIAAVIWLHAAIWLDVPGYDASRGIPGTGFLGSLLYTMTSRGSTFTITLIYFAYGCAGGFALIVPCHLLATLFSTGRRRR